MEQVTLEQTSSQRAQTAISKLARSPLFEPAPRTLSLVECTKLTYQRAKAFVHAYGNIPCCFIDQLRKVSNLGTHDRPDYIGYLTYDTKVLRHAYPAYSRVRCGSLDACYSSDEPVYRNIGPVCSTTTRVILCSPSCHEL